MLQKNRIISSILILLILLITISLYNYLKYFPIAQTEFSNPDFSVGLDKINQFYEILSLPMTTFQYGPGYEFLYKILSFFKYTSLDTFYKITHFYLPFISIIFICLLFKQTELSLLSFIFLVTLLLSLEFFIYSSIRYVPIICISYLLLQDLQKNKINYIFIILYGFFFCVGIDYGIITLIAIFLAIILKIEYLNFSFRFIYFLFLLLLSVISNHYIITGNFNILTTIKDLFYFSKFFDITDPSFSYNYPVPNFNIKQYIIYLINFQIFNFIKLLFSDLKILVFYYFPIFQGIIIFVILIRSYLHKRINEVSYNLVFLSALTIGTQVRILFGPGFIIYNYFQIILLIILFFELLKFQYKNFVYIFLIFCFLITFLVNINSKFYNHMQKAENTAINFPVNYNGMYISNELNDNIESLRLFFKEKKIYKIFVYPWSFITTTENLKKINLIYDDRHLISENRRQNQIFENIKLQTDIDEYLLLDLNYSLGIAFFNNMQTPILNIKNQYSNFTRNSIVFNGEKNYLREFILRNYEYETNFGNFYLFRKKTLDTKKFTNEQKALYEKSVYKNLYKIKLLNSYPVNFFDIEFRVTQMSFFKKVFGQSYFNINFYDKQNNLISNEKRPISRSYYDDIIKMRFFVKGPSEKINVDQIEISFDKIKVYNFVPSKLDILSINFGSINKN